MIEFSEKDNQQLKELGISEEKVRNQIETFKAGIPFVKLKKAAVVGNGISQFSQKEEKELVNYFESHRGSKELLKFVPASGAASRMFKAMFNFLEVFDPVNESFTEYVKRTGDTDAKRFVEGMASFPFYNLIKERLGAKFDSSDEAIYLFVKEMLSEDGLNYGFYPKGLLPFHDYGKTTATPFEEHLKEAANYASSNSNGNLHFTISPQHDEMFKKEEAEVSGRVSDETNTKFDITYSNQKTSTDTIAVDMQNQPFRNSDGSILFRPGGHGALIENLNEQDADVIFIKNIDNVVIDKNLKAVSDSKKMLGGLLLKIQDEAYDYARRLESDMVSDELLSATQRFLSERLNVRFEPSFNHFGHDEKLKILKQKINRPIRVCGMVKNEGEPGGGPFFIEDRNGNTSLQIIESAQIDMDDAEQVSILKNSTHFNPVDLVCGVRNHRGEKYDLLDYVDAKQGFITGKTREGKELKALELPGLWNGAMAFWNTIFVEVPLVTFNPVKTVNDLLKPTHQA